MATVKPPVIERPKKYGRCGESIHDLDYIMAKKEYVNAPQADAVQTSQEPVIPNPLEPRPAIDIIQSMSMLQSDRTDKYLLPTQQTIYAEADDSTRYFPVWASDVRTHQLSKFQTIIEMFPPGSICKIYLPDIDPYWAIINKIEFSTTHLEPALYIEFFKLEDVLAQPAETSLDTLPQYPIMQSCVIYIPEQIESIDSSDAAEMSRELIKNEMLAIKKQIAVLKDNLRRLSRLRNSRDSTSRLFSEIDRKYRLFAQSLEQKRVMKLAEPEVVL